MTHAELVDAIVAQARSLGHWAWAATDTSPQQSPGWVDVVVLSRHGCALFIEVKSADGRRSKEQVLVGTLLQRCGFQYRLYRPADWLNGTISRELTEL